METKKAVKSICYTCIALLLLTGCRPVTASWYSTEESHNLMANGRRLNDEDLTCASWDYPFGTILKITNEDNGKSVVCVVSDRGPAKALYRKGRKIDLTKRAFNQIASLEQGIISVKIEEN